MLRTIFYMILGYLSGSILFARIFGVLLKQKDVTEESTDGNPGTANAFMYGGFCCGALTLCGDLAKGFLPVYLYLKGTDIQSCGMELSLIMLSPVLGHIFPVFHGFHGGKGIAASFGSLLGLLPELIPALTLAAVFIFFSLILRIIPHYSRTLWTYRCTAVLMGAAAKNIYVWLGFLLIALLINIHMRVSCDNKEKCQVRLLWMH